MEITKIPKKTVTLITPKNVSLVDKDRYQQKRVAAYCRVSTDSEEQLTSYKTQKKVYTEMIQANKDWTMVDIYADEGISGTMTKNRDDFNRMIKDCLAGKIDYIITKSVSRFARNTVELLFEDLLHNGGPRGIIDGIVCKHVPQTGVHANDLLHLLELRRDLVHRISCFT